MMRKVAPPIYFYSLLSVPSLRNRRLLKTFLQKLFRQHKIPLKLLSYVFCSDEYLLVINKQFLSHDAYTDIITFDLTTTGEALTAEIYISIERVKENARQLQTSFADELHRVIFHGALHLCGYRDRRNSEKALMREKENACLQTYAQLVKKSGKKTVT